MVARGWVSCDGCEGCGHVADTATREPYIYYTRDLIDADGRPLFPEVKKIACGKCKGLGIVPRHMIGKCQRKKRRF